MAVALIVDDDTLTHTLYQHILNRAGVTTISARNGSEGIALAQTDRPDCIIMNIYMPMMDGITACQQLKRDEQTAAIPIIICTAALEAVETNLLERSGADAVLRKPIQALELIDTVKRLLKDF